MIRELPWLGVGEEPHSKLYTSGISAPATGPGVFRESARGQAARVLRGRGARSGARAPRLLAPALRGFQRPAGPPPGRGGAGPGSGAPAQLTRPLSLCWLPPRRAGPGRRHVGPVRALGSGSQRPALGWQRLLQPPEPALQRGHPQDLRGQRVSRCFGAPALPGPPGTPRPPGSWGGGVSRRRWGESGRGRSCRAPAGTGRGPGGGCSRRPPPHGGWRNRSSFRPSAVRPFWGCTEPLGPLGQPRVRHPLGTRPWGRVGTVMFT